MLCYRCGSHVPDGSSTCGTCGQTFTVKGRKPTASPRPRKRSTPSVPDAYQPGTKIAERFEVRSAVGQGPVGVVYRAIDRAVDVEVAVKVVTSKLIQSDDEKAAFRKEARLVRALSHMNCIRQYEEGFDGDRAYIVMQYLEGLSLRKIIDLRHGKGQRFELSEIDPIFQQLCAALEHAHGTKVGNLSGIAHGHLKPQNVIVLPDLLKVVDFREATFIPRVPYIAAQRVRGGEVAYLAPEVVDGGKITPAADIFSLGILLGEMVAGEVGSSPQCLDLTSVEGVPRGMEGIYRRMVAPRPEDRYGNVFEVMEDISAVVAGRAPPHAASRRPMVASPCAPSKPTAEVLDSGEFELLEGDAEEVALDDDEVQFADDDLEEVDLELPSSPGVDANEPPKAGRRRESFGLDSPSHAPPPPPVEAMDVEEEPESEEIEVSDKDLEAALFDDIGSDGGVMPGRQETPQDEEEPDNRGDGPTVVGRPRQTGRVARPIEQTATFREQPTGRREMPQPPEPDLATDPGYELPTGLIDENIVPDREAARIRAQKKKGGGKGWGRFAAVVVFSAIATMGVVFALSEDVRVVFGLGDLFSSSAGEDPPPPDDPVGETKTPGSDDPATPPEPTDPPPVDTKQLDPDESTPPDPVQPDRPPVPETKKTAPTRPRPDPVQTKQPERTRPPRDPPPPTKVRDTDAGDTGQKVAAVTPRPGGDQTEAADRCPGGMIFVPAGRFMIGSAINDPMRNFAEHNLSEVQTEAYCVDRYEYGGRGRQPVSGVTWYRAKELCEARGRRLCTEEEWERACKGPRNFRFPYGNTFDPSACNTEDADGNPRDVAAGGSFSRCRSGYGVFDMAGNVAEWTASRFQPGIQDRTHKGGAANRPDWDTRCATRGNRPPNSRDPLLGFRCCADPN